MLFYLLTATAVAVRVTSRLGAGYTGRAISMNEHQMMERMGCEATVCEGLAMLVVLADAGIMTLDQVAELSECEWAGFVEQAVRMAA